MRGPSALKTLAVLFVCLVAGYFVFGSRGYGEVSDKAYDIATALYSVCNRQDASQLAKLEKLMASAREDASLSPAEAEMLQEILRSAQEGDWQRATTQSRALMEDQVKNP